MIYKISIIIFLSFILYGCGKIGALALSEDKLDNSIITYPCLEECMKKFEAEKQRQQSVILRSD